ncbi:MAG TPA: cupin domain-containing protein [Anaerolineae bacterium]|jgi:gentisate 1,2-dioxygenase
MSQSRVLDGQAGKEILMSIMENTPKGIFFKDLKNMPLDNWDVRGKNSRGIFFDTNTRMFEAHVAEIPPGTNKKAHRHQIEAIIYILKGTGYSLIWAEGEQPTRYDWAEGDMFAVPMNYWHQHFNSDPAKTARYFAITNINFMTSVGLFDTAQQEE